MGVLLEKCRQVSATSATLPRLGRWAVVFHPVTFCFIIKRVLNVHLTKDSPYNTYKYGGLPPGPINLPSIASIDAVLNPESHAYLYFCAKEDFSGYHAFARNEQEHLVNARRYQAALTRSGIMK